MRIDAQTKYELDESVTAIVEFSTPRFKIVRGEIANATANTRGYIEYDVRVPGTNFLFARIPEERVFPVIGTCQEAALENFAESIIKECINTLEFHGCDDAVPYIKWMAANHFGIR